MAAQDENGVCSNPYLRGSFKSEFGESQLEMLPLVVLGKILKMTDIEDLKELRLSSLTLRQRVELLETERFKHWHLPEGKELELNKLSEEVRIIKDLRIDLNHDNLDEGSGDLQELLSSMKSLVASHEELKSLQLHFRNFRERKFLKEMIRSFGRVTKSLDMVSCSPLALDKDNLPCLERLSVVGCGLSDADLKSVVNDFKNKLTHLKLGNTRLSAEGIFRPGMFLPNLTSLNLRFYSNLTELGLCEMISVMPNVKTLILPEALRLTGEEISKSDLCLPSLCSLNLGGCIYLTDIGLSELLSVMPNLQSLVLSHTNGLTGEGFSRACKSLRRLTSLDLSGCDHISDCGTYELLSVAPNLESLILPYSSSLTGFGISRAVKFVPRLKRFDVRGCDHITDYELSCILSSLANLQTIFLYLARKLTGEGVSRVCKSLPKLKGLHLSDCIRLTNRGLSEILSITPNLQRLTLFGAVEGTLEGVNIIPSIQKIDLNFRTFSRCP